jgi:hypothetical protein
MTPSLRDSGYIVGFFNPTLKRGANNHCAYGAGDRPAYGAMRLACLRREGTGRGRHGTFPHSPL